MSDNNTVYIGNKPPMTYVMVIMTAFNESGNDSVVLKARGRAISRAVDVAEILRNRYMSDVKATEIVSGTEQLPSHDGGTRGVSTLSITLEREKGETPEPEQAVEEEVAEEDVAEEEPPKEEPKETVTEKTEAPSKPHEVSDLKGVGKTTEEKLLQGGYKSVKVIARARADTMSKKTGLSENASVKIIAAAKELLS